MKIIPWKQKKQKAIVLKDGNGGKACSIVYNKETDEIDIVLNKPINLSIDGNLGLAINGELDITSFGDIRIDTFLSNLFINSYNSKFIKDRPESIEKRKKAEKLNQEYNDWLKLNKHKLVEITEKYLDEKKDR